jgi:hypothetical protein
MSVKDSQSSRRNHMRPQMLLKPEADQRARRIGGELDAGAGFFQALGLFKHDNTEAAARKRQGCGQPTDAGASDNDRARRRQVLLRAGVK